MTVAAVGCDYWRGRELLRRAGRLCSDPKSPQFACSARTRRGELVQDRG
jgi:hypothetical protein